jgi:cytochrome P450
MVHARQDVRAYRQRDTAIRGVSIGAGESVCPSYPSAHREGDVFTEPSRFDVCREPDRHLGFGSGVHFCLGAALARMEVDIFFSQLIPRLTSIELAGEPKFSPTSVASSTYRCDMRCGAGLLPTANARGR